MILLFLFLFLFQSNTNAFYSEWDSVLQEHVKQGFVDYKGLQNQPENLKQFLEKATNVQKQDFEKWEKKEQLAFYINLYNALTIKLILSEYPVKSIKDIGNFFQGPWSRDVFSLFGNTITLNNLEHDIIRKQFNEPRIHLALVCAAKACPPLRSESYRAEILNELLENQAKNYQYKKAKFKYIMIDSTLGFVLTFLFWFLGGFGWLRVALGGFGWPLVGLGALGLSRLPWLALCGPVGGLGGPGPTIR